jgi:hypothetical protein
VVPASRVDRLEMKVGAFDLVLVRSVGRLNITNSGETT